MNDGARRGYLALLGLALIWGYNWVIIKVATEGGDPFSVSALRCILGALCLFATLAIMRRPLRPPAFGSTLLLGLLQTTGFIFFQTAAVALGGAGKSAILVYTMPFWTVLFAAIFLHERVGRFGWIALGLAALGLACVAYPLDLASGLLGKLYAVISGISWGASIIVYKRIQARAPVDAINLTAWQMLYGAIPLAVVSLLYPAHHVALTASFVGAILYLTVLGTAIAWLLWNFALRVLSAGVASIGSLVTPVVGVLAAWAVLGERPEVVETIGLAFIVAALAANTIPALRRRAS